MPFGGGVGHVVEKALAEQALFDADVVGAAHAGYGIEVGPGTNVNARIEADLERAVKCPFVGGDDDHAVPGAGAPDGGGCGVLQDGDADHVVGVQVLYGLVIGKPVNDDERVGAGEQGALTAHADAGADGVKAKAGDDIFQPGDDIGADAAVEQGAVDSDEGAGGAFFGELLVAGGYDNALHLLYGAVEPDGKRFASRQGDAELAGKITDIGKAKPVVTGSQRQAEMAGGIGAGMISTADQGDGGAGQRQACSGLHGAAERVLAAAKGAGQATDE